MLRTLSLAAVIAAFAASANAAEVKVNLEGKSSAEAHALVAKAAATVCHEAYINEPLGYYMWDACAQTTVQDTWAKLDASPIAFNAANRSIVLAIR